MERSVPEVIKLLTNNIHSTATRKFNKATEDYTSGEMASWTELEREAVLVINGDILTEGMLFDEALFAGINITVLSSTIINNAKAFRQLKAYVSGTRKKLLDTVNTFTSVDECILFEKTPYVDIVTEQDISVDLSDMLVLGDTVTKYKNNCTDW